MQSSCVLFLALFLLLSSANNLGGYRQILNITSLIPSEFLTLTSEASPSPHLLSFNEQLGLSQKKLQKPQGNIQSFVKGRIIVTKRTTKSHGQTSIKEIFTRTCIQSTKELSKYSPVMSSRSFLLSSRQYVNVFYEYPITKRNTQAQEQRVECNARHVLQNLVEHTCVSRFIQVAELFRKPESGKSFNILEVTGEDSTPLPAPSYWEDAIVPSATPDLHVSRTFDYLAPSVLVKRIEESFKHLQERVADVHVTVSTRGLYISLSPDWRDLITSLIHEVLNCTRNSSKPEALEYGPANDPVIRAAREPAKLKRKSFNFASEGSGAQILAWSANTIGAKNIINENADKYMLAPCVTDNGSLRWVDIELSEYVKVQSVQTANYEHYSSQARRFAVLGAESYPPTKWNILGVFDVEDTGDVQTFEIIGAAHKRVSRFLRVVYEGKQGHEYYCPVSIFRAFGKNLYADLKDNFQEPNSFLSDLLAVNKTTPGKKEFTGKSSPDMQEFRQTAVSSNIIESRLNPRKCHFTNASDNSDIVFSLPPSDMESKRDLNIIINGTISNAPDDNVLRQLVRKIRSVEWNQFVMRKSINSYRSRLTAAIETLKAHESSCRDAFNQTQKQTEKDKQKLRLRFESTENLLTFIFIIGAFSGTLGLGLIVTGLLYHGITQLEMVLQKLVFLVMAMIIIIFVGLFMLGVCAIGVIVLALLALRIDVQKEHNIEEQPTRKDFMSPVSSPSSPDTSATPVNSAISTLSNHY